MQNNFRQYFYLNLICILFAKSFGFECKHNSKDLSALNGTWISQTDNSIDDDITYYINLCSGLSPNGADDHQCPSGASVCMKYKNGTVLSAGNFNSSADSLPGGENEELGESWILLTGQQCPQDDSYNLTTSINFKCGPTMGSPVFLDFTGCVNYFEWETNVYCNNRNTVKEVKCYLYDESGNRYDLSPLAKNKGGYLVSSALDTDIYINVCRDISPDALTTGCPAGSAACRKSSLVNFIGLGDPVDSLKRSTDGKLTLTYKSPRSEATAGCTTNPSTTITFICPKRGADKDPVILEDFNCQYVIEWETEYACPDAKLYNETCVLTKQDADIDIDLRPLTRSPGNPYKVSHRDSSSSTGVVYDFYLNVCAELQMDCPDHEHSSRIPACQTKQSDPNFGQSMGSTDHTQLSYVDGELTLTYKGGALCHHNHAQRQTVIKFVCNNTAGDGNPEFSYETDCVYVFTWPTKYACVDHPADETCRVESGNRRYDLSSLVKTSGTNWIGLHNQNDIYGRGTYFINVCHNILQTGDASRCDPGAAICYRENLSTRNLGRYESPPTFDSQTNTTQIKLTNGDLCKGTQRITSTVTFICKPGESESAPVLKSVNNDRCNYDFEWQTAAACELKRFTGTNCKIFADGFTIDLTPLKLPDGQKYIVNSTSDAQHDYFLNVCGPVTGTSCDTLNTKDVGICRSPTSVGGASFVTGQWSSQLTYFDDVVNLTYTGGTPYNDPAKTPRRSEIMFICDQDAGKGTPKYLSEAASDHYYAFEWRTSFACPKPPMECIAIDNKTGYQYDLSSLTKTDSNWAVMGTGNTKYYINVCQSLDRESAGPGCDDSAAICRTKFVSGEEQIDIGNMGQVDSDLRVESEGRLRLTYSGGACNNGSTTVPFITNIQFLCRKDALTSGPSSPLQDGPCEYTIVWDTAAACVLDKDDDTEPCTAKDPNKDYVYNLQPLTREEDQPYTITVNGSQFKLNICGNISTTICPNLYGSQPSSVCQVFPNNTKQQLAEASVKLDFSETGQMVLVNDGLRLGNGDRVHVEVIFECAPEKDLGGPVFDRQEGSTYIFKFLTALACTPISMDCLVQDETGQQYDLNPLVNDHYWTATDPKNAGTTYYINVCRPVNGVPKSSCPDEPIGGCQSASNNQFYNMGYIQSKPLARSDGTLTLHYRNGDICHKGTENEAHRSTRINFFCADTEEGPVFETETDECEYVFNWRTPAACPLKSEAGDSCKVVEPRYNYQFDLSSLRKSGSDYHVTWQEYEYLINVCGPLQDTSKCGTLAGACQTKPSAPSFSPVNAGNGNSKLQYVNGELILNYTGGTNNCHGLYERQTVIRFSCDLSNTNNGPTFIEEAFNCHYLFEWPTPLACPPHKTATCTTHDKDGKSYDLSVLSLLDDNYDVTDTVEKKRYIINVCRSLIHGPNATCPYNAAVCMEDLTKPENATDRYKSLGEPQSEQLQYEDGGHIILTYTNGDQCGNGNRMTTHIRFTCDPTAQTSSPAGHFMVGDCDHHFLWATSAACAAGSPDGGHGGSDTTVKPDDITCQVTNPTTGTVFDLSSLKILKGSAWNVTDSQGHKFEFNICGALSSSACTGTPDIGVCQSEPGKPDNGNKYNAGKAVHNLWYDDGVVIQNFTGGDRCHNGQYSRSTTISFVCNDHRGIGRPEFIDETEDCTYFISWHTNLVCENEIKCSVDTNDFRTIDLSPLSRNPDHVVHSTVDGSIFYLSVCSALTPAKGVLCPAGSGVCQVKPDDGKIHTSLGKPKSSPRYDNVKKTVILEYVNGSTCDTDSSKNFTSRVIFSCLPGPVRSSPVFVEKAGCDFVFQWATAEVCVEAPDNVCGYHDSKTGDFYDFSKLQDSTTPLKVTYHDNTYLINICGPIKSDDTSSCNSHMVCRTKDGLSFGEPSNFKVEKEGDVLIMNYDLGAKCSGGKSAQSTIQFRCDPNAGKGTPKALTSDSGECSIVFEWVTSYVCPTSQDDCTVEVDNHLFDLSLLSKEHDAWNLTDSDKNTYWINVCTGLGGPTIPTEECGPGAAACRKTKDGKTDTLGRIDSQKKLYKDSNTGNLVLEYVNGGTPCSASRSDNKAASTKINFICGPTFGGPVFVNSADNKEQCIFEFKWQTKLACQVEKENLTVVNGEVKDPKVGVVVNLKPIWNQSFEIHDKIDSSTENIYSITLNGSSSRCVDGVICQTIDTGKKTYRVLGSFSSSKYFMDDWRLEATFSTKEKCSDDPTYNVSSVIQFYCNPNDSQPQLLYNRNDCFYMFTWYTTEACVNAVIIQPVSPSNTDSSGQGPGSAAGGSKSASTGGVSTKTVVAIVATFLGAIVLCILLVVFHKQERRESCFLRVRGLFSRRSSGYSQLPTGTMDDIFGEDEEVVTVENAAGNEEDPIISITPATPSYHDDSDEDLLA